MAARRSLSLSNPAAMAWCSLRWRGQFLYTRALARSWDALR